MENLARLKKIVKAIDNGSLALPEGGITKNWFCYRLDITDLVWGRNMMDGWEILVSRNGRTIGEIQIDGNLSKVNIEEY